MRGLIPTPCMTDCKWRADFECRNPPPLRGPTQLITFDDGLIDIDGLEDRGITCHTLAA